jgi:3-hydroxypropionyl-CoA synthetase (ADP-forming)
MPGLTRETMRRIDALLDAAEREGRTSLFEHEVYGVLGILGLSVPRFVFLRDAEALTDAMLQGLGRTVVVKVVSPGIPHKQKLGGVRKVAATDTLYVQYVMSRMREEVLSHFPAGAGPGITGFLVVEHIPHTEALGFEVLVGFREDPAFGPVLTVSKGGDDAEFFATHFDPASLHLPPMEYRDAFAFARTMHIRHRYEQIGHPEYLRYMANALAGFSSLAVSYSPCAGGRRVFTSFEVNPFALSKDGRFVALDGLAEFAAAPTAGEWSSGVDLSNLDALFRPDGVAVIGASSDVTRYSMARDIAEQLHEMRRGDLYLVNPHGGTIRFGSRDYPLYADLASIPARVELAVYAAPALHAPDFLRSLAGTSVRAVILIPGVPSSTPYAEYVRQLREALPPGVRVVGPNCMGVYHMAEHGTPGGGSRPAQRDGESPCGGAGIIPGINTLFINEKRLAVRSTESANAVLLTQSGALSVTVIDKLRAASPLRSIVSFGNKLDVKVGDLLAHFSADPRTRIIALYLEGLAPGEGRAFFEQARQSAKPIVAYKGGRTEAGMRSAASHTAALSGNYEVFRAACRQAGVILAETIEEFYDRIRVFSLLADRPPRGNRVAGVVNAGFESTVSADELRGLTQAALAPRTIERLNVINRSGLVDTSSPFLDITPMADDGMYARYVEAVIEDDAVDCLFVAVVPHAVTLKTVPETCRDPDGLATLLVQIAKSHDKPIVVSVNAGRHYADFVAVLEEGGLPVFPEIRSAITSLDAYVSWCVGRRPGGARQGTEAEAARPGGSEAGELFQLVDRNGAPAGQAARGECHGNPALIHLVVHVHVFDGEGRLYVQKRALCKDTNPGMWDASVGGHVAAGEAVVNAVVREAREELGIDASGASFLYSYLHEGSFESEYAQCFALTWTGPVHPDPSEIDEGRFLTVREVEGMIGTGAFTPLFETEWPMLVAALERMK